MKRSETDNHIILNNPGQTEEIKQCLIAEHKIPKEGVQTVFADDVLIKTLLEDALVFPLFSSKKLIHIKNCEGINLEDCKLLKGFFDNPEENVFLILSGTKIKSVLNDYVDIEEEKGEVTVQLFPAIFRMKSLKDKRKVIALLREHKKNNPFDFPTTINAAFIYIRNIVKNHRNIDKNILDAYQKLYSLDFKLKTGRIDTEDFDIFLFSLLP